MQAARESYQTKLRSIELEESAKKRTSERVSIFRPLLFLPGIVLVLAGYLGQSGNRLALTLGWILIVGFFVVLSVHEGLRMARVALQRRAGIYRRLIARLDRDWSQLVPTETINDLIAPYDSPVAIDLDLFGHRSLFQWCSLAATPVGQRCVADWMTKQTDSSVVLQRQLAVQEIAPLCDLREEILYLASSVSGSFADPEKFCGWASGASWIEENRTAYRLSFIGPFAVIVGLASLLIGMTVEQQQLEIFGFCLAAFGFVCNLILTAFKIGPIHDIFSAISSNQGEVASYQKMFEQVEQLNPKCDLLKRLKQEWQAESLSAATGFQRLAKTVFFANFQRTPSLYILYFILQFTVLWDFRILKLLERWQRRYGQRVQSWFDSLGEFEAILSGSAICHENPDWTFPVFTESGDAPMAVQQIAHPLLPLDVSIGNDLRITKDRPVLLITGSNMAGKSTFLRSLGVNLVLGRLGSPVLAKQMQVLPFAIETSIRVSDSLQDGVSFFMAELKRLRSVVESVESSRDQGIPAFVLLDEILQGTNSRERQIAVMQVVNRLRSTGAITAISTHDLDLADHPDILATSQIVHFHEQFETVDGVEAMTFDYVMRAGPTPTTNALKLLELVGLK